MRARPKKCPLAKRPKSPKVADDVHQWRISKFASNQIDSMGALPVRASNSLIKDELLLSRWSPASLSLELDRYIWKDDRQDITIRDLWELLATYVYLPRLRNQETLLEAIKDGAANKDYFGYATSKNEDGTYAGLAFGRRASVFMDDLGVVVRKAAAENAQPEPTGGSDKIPEPPINGGGPTDRPPVVVTDTAPKRFHGSIRLNPKRLGSAAGQVGEEVIQHLASLVDSEVDVVFEISVKVPDGIPDRVVRTVSENAATLKFDHFEFEAE